MNLENRYAPRQDVASELIDGEAIIIDLASGIYFSLNGVGGRIWSLLAKDLSLAEILAILPAEYEVALDVAQQDLNTLVEQLLSEKLVEPTQERTSSDHPAALASAAKASYSPPRLEIYRDMGDLLALDPPAPGLSEIAWQANPVREHDDH